MTFATLPPCRSKLCVVPLGPSNLYAADETSEEESESKAKEEDSPRMSTQGEMDAESEHTASSSPENATTGDAIKRPAQARKAIPPSDQSGQRSVEPSDRSSQSSEEDFGNREDQVLSVDAPLVPSTLSFSTEKTLKDLGEADFSDAEHQERQQHPQESEKAEPVPSPASGRHAAGAVRRTPHTRKSAVEATSYGGASQQEHHQDEIPAASERGVKKREAARAPAAKETTAKHKTSTGESRPEERRSKHASSASTRHQREHRHHHRHKDRQDHKDHKDKNHKDHKDPKVARCVAAISTPKLLFCVDLPTVVLQPHHSTKGLLPAQNREDS